jgi:hypothetical protein
LDDLVHSRTTKASPLSTSSRVVSPASRTPNRLDEVLSASESHYARSIARHPGARRSLSHRRARGM